MSQLRKEELSIVAKNQLSDSLDKVRDALRDAERGFMQDVMDSVLGREWLSADLALSEQGLGNGGFEYKHFRSPSQLVIRRAADVGIWGAVITLIRTISQSTPPPSVPPSFDNTPITHSSASQQGPEQTRQKIKSRIFEEICSCTHRSVEELRAKYFESKNWE
ncbi:hypothetical protein DV736_g2493, partial [Chaetothyriales sp. CBS 134916]